MAESTPPPGSDHLCSHCRVVKQIEDFPPSKRGGRRASDGYPQSWVCRICVNADAMARWQTKADFVNAYKLEQGCADCGYNDRPEALGFDHLPGTVKVANVSILITRGSMEKILEEIEKCEVVCANCHAIRTKGRGQHQGWRLITPGAKGLTLERLAAKQPPQLFPFP